jgi:segregation and condensation protein A
MTEAVDDASDAGAAAIAAWEDPPRDTRADTAPVLSVDGFDGPLDWLLEMVRAHKIDLARLSIAALIEAFAAAMSAALTDPGGADPHGAVHRRAAPSGTGGRIEHWAAWTVMAASLTELWSRLLLPPDAPEVRAAVTEAEALRRRLLERARMRAAADWLERQPQLGQAVFARGHTPPPSARAGALTDLLRACLVALQVSPAQADQIRPLVLRLWQASDAIRHMSQRLGALPDGSRLSDYLPALADGPDNRLRRRAALASTLVAGLELAREEVLTLQQDTVWAAIRVVRRQDGPDAAPATGPDS